MSKKSSKKFVKKFPVVYIPQERSWKRRDFFFCQLLPLFRKNDKKEEFKDELSEKIISQAFMNPSSEIVSFKVTGFKKGPGNVVIVLGSMILKQSHYNNSDLINNKLKSALAKYFYEGPKTL